MKIFLKIISLILVIIFFFIIYLSFVGIETKRFNNQISNRLKNIDENIKIDLKKIKITLNLFKLKLDAKTLDSRLTIKNKQIEIQSLKTQISIVSFINDTFFLESLEISSKVLEIKNLISFLREFYNTPQLYIFEKVLRNGFLIADIKLNFDKKGQITNNYKINGFVKDVKLDFLKNYEVKKLNFIFDFNNKRLLTKDLDFDFNSLNFTSDELLIKKIGKSFMIKGQMENKELNLNEEQIKFFINKNFNLDINNVKFSSINKFSFKINKKFKFKDFKISSKIKINKLLFSNTLNIKNIFPKIRDEFEFLNHDLKIDYRDNILSIDGNGDVFFQNQKDEISYTMNKKDNKLKFKSTLGIIENLFVLKLLNYKNDINDKTLIDIEGRYDSTKKILNSSFYIKENKNEIYVKDLIVGDKLKFIDLNYVKLDYIDQNDFKNSLKITKKNNQFFLKGSSFNLDNLIENLLIDDKQNDFTFFDKNYIFEVDIDEVRLDKNHVVDNFHGSLTYNKDKIKKANLSGNFSKDKEFKLTINFNETGRITTLFVGKAESIIRRYKFIKGFKDGILDFNSLENESGTTSTLKIYDFKLSELPALTKILTLASLQGIADILSGEGIGFDELEMNFKTADNLITIDEIFAIGPAISILMNGYIEKGELVSLRGSLVPATTINKAIGSIPILGKILVGSKTGEGVFGVSFKIKGPPGNLETSVNPIKTLTPRFISRTLEKIKKN